MVCKKCNVEFTPTKGLTNYCSLKCRNSRTFSDTSKLKKSIKTKKAWEDDKYIDALFCKELVEFECRNCKMVFKKLPYQAKRKKYCSKLCLITCPEFKKQQSLNTTQTYIDGKKVYGGKTKWIEVNCSKGIFKVQGTYEVKAIEILELQKQNKEIKDWEYTNDRVEYLGSDNLTHNYLIDFKVFNFDGSFYYVEVKGRKVEKDFLKWEAVKQKGLTLFVWEKEYLFGCGA